MTWACRFAHTSKSEYTPKGTDPWLGRRTNHAPPSTSLSTGVMIEISRCALTEGQYTFHAPVFGPKFTS